MREAQAFLDKSTRSLTLAAVVAITAAAWHGLAIAADGMMRHPASPGAPRIAAAFVMWMAMMLAMMLPAVSPWVLVLSSDGDREAPRTGWRRVTVFLGGYFLVWAAFAAVASAVQYLLERTGALHGPTGSLGTTAAASVLILAGGFQLTALKDSCLRKCRTPLGVFLEQWHDGSPPALRIGLRHGMFCVGCCWALMAVVFALGVMSLVWMAVVAVEICAERLIPRGRLVARGVGAIMVGWGVWMLVAPLTAPPS